MQVPLSTARLVYKLINQPKSSRKLSLQFVFDEFLTRHATTLGLFINPEVVGLVSSSQIEDATGIIRRLMAGAGVTSAKDLASALGVTPQAISSAKRKGRIPDGWVKAIAEQFNQSFDWLLYGDRPESEPAHVQGEDFDSYSIRENRSPLKGIEYHLWKIRSEYAQVQEANLVLTKENAELRVRIAELEAALMVEKMRTRIAPDEKDSDGLRQSA